MLQVVNEVVKATKAEVANAATVAAEAKAGRGNGRQVERFPTDASIAITGSGAASAKLDVADKIKEVSMIAKRALLLYIVEYCGRNLELWASVTENIRHTGDGRNGVQGRAPLPLSQRGLLKHCYDKAEKREAVGRWCELCRTKWISWNA